MKANHAINPEKINNSESFSNDFFQKFVLKSAPNPLILNDQIQKIYQFPTLYSDVTCSMATFLCDYDKAKKILPHPKLNPVRMTKGRGLVVISCYEYKNVFQIAPYNEISMMIPVLFDPQLDIPILPMLAPALFPSLGYHVFQMPVTSKENQIRGNKIWGLPKTTEDIDIFEKNGECVTIAKEQDGTAYFQLRVPMTGIPTSFDVSANVYSSLAGKLISSRTSFKAQFQVNKMMKVLFKKGMKPDKQYLTIGSTSSARILRELDIEEHPFQFRFAKHLMAAFTLPNQELN